MFKSGDTVRLKSGGPVMTVAEAWDSGWLKAAWFQDGDLKSSNFHNDMLELIS